ncbi:MAG: amidohydrolase family protein [Saprospiraceae bacterium]|nr:amidohydrolase family protein [Saprospiraceae bacterium]
MNKRYQPILKFILFITCLSPVWSAKAQETIYPVSNHQGTVAITGATIHIGNGKVIDKGTLVIRNTKIEAVGASVAIPGGSRVIPANGAHVYPGIIASGTNLGLSEISSVRALSDFSEIGDYNPSVKVITAYNAESRVIPTVRSNGVLLAHITPRGGTISGTSSIVQLDAWNWQDAVYKLNNGIHLNLPAMINRPRPFAALQGLNQGPPADAIKTALLKVDEIRNFLREAQAYAVKPEPTNLKYEAVKGLFDRTQKLFIHCDLVKEIMIALDIKKEFNLEVVIVGGSDSWMVANLLKEQGVPVILSEPHTLPSTADDAVDQPYKTGYQLKQAGVLFSISLDANDGYWQQRCLPFQAGTMAAYGLSKEEALQAITLDAATILGIDKITGSLEVGKDANVVISQGDILDMKSSKVTHAFIQGRAIDLNNKHSQLFEKYKFKYGIK